MSASVKMMGGGGGPSASIFVKGLNETDVVKATQLVENPAYIKLPNDYTQLEYIESTGTQHIDTALKFGSGNSYMLNTRVAYTTLEPEYQIMGFSGNMGHGIGTDASTWWEVEDSSVSVNVAYDLEWYLGSNKSYYRKVDGVNISSGTVALTPPTSYSLMLLATKKDSSINTVDYRNHAKMYSATVRVNDALVRDLIPAKRNSDGVLGLYDLVNNVFYTNAGSGTFIAGPEVTQYIDSGVVKEGKWTKKANPKVVGLPAGYTQLESIAGTGTQWVNTEIIPHAGYYIEMVASLNYPSDGALFGAENSGTAGRTIILYDSTLQLFRANFYDSNWQDYSGLTIGRKYAISYNLGTPQNWTIDGSVISSMSNTVGTSNYPIFINATNRGGTPTLRGYFEFERFTIYSDSTKTTKLFDGIPAKRNSDGAIGMYDLATATFFGNAGTGSFIAGEEIQPIGGHLISRIKDFGMWTVTATNGELTATQDVLIDVITDYEIEMELKNYLMLYDFGDECEEVTGGWVKTSDYDSATKNENSVYFPNGKRSGIVTSQRVDITGYNRLFAQMLAETNGSYPWCGLISSQNSEDRVKFDDGGHVLTNVYISGHNLNENVLCPLTISAFEGSYYVGMVNSSTSNSGYCRNVFITKPDDITTLCTKAGLSAPTDLATLIADTTSISAIMANEEAVKYMVANCTGDFMASFVGNSACLDALNDSPYVDLVFANKHWKKFLKMVDVTGKRLYLYRDGDECVDVTGGWQAQALGLNATYNSPNAPTLTKNSTNMVMSRTGVSDYRCGIILPKNKIDFTAYGSIKAVVTFPGINTNCIIYGNYRKDNLGSFCEDGTKWFEFNNSTPAVTNKTLTGDIMSCNGLFVPYFSMYSVGSITIHRLWIEEVLQ